MKDHTIFRLRELAIKHSSERNTTESTKLASALRWVLFNLRISK